MAKNLLHPRTLCLVLLLACVEPARADAPPIEVTVAVPVHREVVDYADMTGRTAASQEVWIRAHVSGYLRKVFFKDGAEVKKGDLLFEIDSRPYLAELDKAKAEVSRCEVRLRRAVRALELANKRRSTNPISEEESERMREDGEDAQTALNAAKAAVSLAMLNVDFTRLTAPIDGRIGRALMDAGNVVKADESLLTTIVDSNPCYVYFEVDEKTALRLLRRFQGVGGKVSSAQQLPASVGLADEDGLPHMGMVDFIDNRADPDRGTVKFRAKLPNPNGLLSPGLFARVRVPLGEPHKALLVADSAIHVDQGRRFVYVVDDKNRVVSRRVTAGALHENALRMVEEGLGPEDRVVIGGLTGTRPAASVKPRLGDMMAVPKADK